MYLLTTFTNNPNVLFWSAVLSLIIGIAIIIIGFYLKKKRTSWWPFLTLFGSLVVIVNVFRLLI